jgi:hypothetical protein
MPVASPPGEPLPLIGTRFETLTSLLKRQTPGRPGSLRPTAVLHGGNPAPRGLQKRIACLYFDKYFSKYTTRPGMAPQPRHAMNLRRCAVQRRTHRMRSATRKLRSLWQCVGWITDQMRVNRSCSRFEGWTSPARCSMSLIGMREAPSAVRGRCSRRFRTGARPDSGRCSWCSLRNSALYRSSEIAGSGSRSTAPRLRPSHHSCSRVGSRGASKFRSRS